MDEQQRLELLSAYIDGEVTTEEKQQVEEWLSWDPQAQQTYQSLQKLRYGLRDLSPSTTTSHTEALTDRVIAKSHRKTLKQSLVWGTGAVVAMLVTAAWAILPGNNSPVSRLATSNEPKESSEALMIAVDQPITDSYELTTASSNSLRLPLNRPLLEMPKESPSY